MNRLIRNAALLMALMLLLTACGSGPNGTRIKAADEEAKLTGLAFYEQGDYFIATDWLDRAWQRDKSDNEVLVALLDSWLQLNEKAQFWKLLNEVDMLPDAAKIMEAELLSQDDRCQQSLQLTQHVLADMLSAAWQLRYWQHQASCQQATQAFIAAVESLVNLQLVSDDPLMAQVWNNQIVNNLIRISEDDLIMAIGDPQYDAITQGWLEAAYVNFGADGVSGDGWMTQWPNHPASQYFLDMNQVSKQQSVAVLLPLSGRFEAAAKALQKGLLTASIADDFNQFELQFYDTGSEAENLSAAWYTAQDNNVDMIIGPLDKASIQAVEQMPKPALPVVLLNQSEADYFQFTLSPEREAQQVAERMYADGQRRVVIMAPNEEWGERMSQAFAQRFVDLGGLIIDNTYFDKGVNDFSVQLRRTLGLIESQLRAKNLQSFLQIELSSDEVVRADMDAIFLAARPELARLMVPQLKFHHAAAVPVYATSHVFDGVGNEQHNRDLQGVTFAVSPIEIPSSRLLEVLPFGINNLKNSRKLFALGYDAYQLITRLEWMSRVNTGVVEGLTGDISLDFNGQFNRELQWAQYNNGSIVPLPN